MDATGRGSRTPARPERHGLPRPAESTVDVGIVHTGYVFPRRPDDVGSVPVVLSSARPGQRRLAVALAVEGGRWLVTAIGYRGDRPSGGVAGFRAFLDTTDAPEIAALAGPGTPWTGRLLLCTAFPPACAGATKVPRPRRPRTAQTSSRSTPG